MGSQLSKYFEGTSPIDTLANFMLKKTVVLPHVHF